MPDPMAPSEDEVLGYFRSLSNWGRWGGDDSLGTLNLITTEKRIQAGRLVSRGISVTCSRPVIYNLSETASMPPALHFMQGTGEAWANVRSTGGQLQSVVDFVCMPIHGAATTHLDSFSHFFWDGRMYNGHSSALVTSRGADVGAVDIARDGIVTRGVLLDIAGQRNVDWMESGQAVYPEDLIAAEQAAGIRVEPGDALFVRTGSFGRRRQLGPIAGSEWPEPPGVHAACLRYLHERGVAVLGTDAACDVLPSGYDTIAWPVHQVGIVAMGLWIVDFCNFEEIATICRELGRWHFLLTLAPLRLTAATGSPVNPIAVF